MSDVRVMVIDGEIWDRRPKLCAKCSGTTGGVSVYEDDDMPRYYCEEDHQGLQGERSLSFYREDQVRELQALVAKLERDAEAKSLPGSTT